MQQGRGSARRPIAIGGLFGRSVMIALAVALTSLAFAGTVQAAKVKYFGTIDQPQGDSGRPAPTIELLVHLDRKKNGQLQPDHVNRITTRNMGFRCSDDQMYWPGSGYRKDFFSNPGTVDSHPWGVKKRRFSGTGDDDVDRLVAAGRIPPKGAATGTVRLLRPAEADDPDAPCDSGTVSFTARKK